MILLVNICKEKLHYLEFVKPIEYILIKNKIKYFTKHYSELKKRDIIRCKKIIICGTSLQDDYFVNNLNSFNWIKDLDKPLLGICGGMQLIQLVFGGKIGKKTEIGFYREKFIRSFLGLNGEKEVYHLHNNFVTLPPCFEKFTTSQIPQAIKHKSKEIYGVLFHPEVRQKDMILEFTKL